MISNKLFGMLLFLPLMLMGCGEDEKKADAKPKLVMVTSGDFPPFEFFTTSEGKSQVVGSDIDLAKRIGTYLGFEIEIRIWIFQTLYPLSNPDVQTLPWLALHPPMNGLKPFRFLNLTIL
jgi:ABC-type amino acid transport substrate-binding protein